MIRALVAAGKRVGITANSHAVIRNLLTEVQSQAAKAGETVRLGAKVSEADEGAVGVREYGKKNLPGLVFLAGIQTWWRRR